MDLVLSHATSARFWRVKYPPWKTLGDAPAVCRFNDLAVTDEDVWALAPEWVTGEFLSHDAGVLHTLTFKKAAKRNNATHNAHVWSGSVPPGSFYDLRNGVYVCSPGFLFLQMADRLSAIQLVSFACELCGTYSFNPQARRGFVTRKHPLTSVAQLEEYVQGAVGARGRRRAQEALRFALDKSASPMETACALLLTLPHRLGGFSLPKPRMNADIPLHGTARLVSGAEYCKGDLCWSDAQLDVEYLGGYDHSGTKAMKADRERVNALAEMDFEIIELTSQQVYNDKAFEVIARRIARKLGKRIRAENLGLTEPRKALRKALFNWNCSFGCLSQNASQNP